MTETLFHVMFHVFKGGYLTTTLGNRLVGELRGISEIVQMRAVAVRMKKMCHVAR